MRAGPFLPIILAAAFSVAGVAAAASAELAGRWVAEKQQLMLDISACGEGWCGVEVAEGKACGQTVLRVGPTRLSDTLTLMAGRLVRAPQAASYAVEAKIVVPDIGGPPTLHISGHTGETLEPWRRTFPFQEVFVRAGEAICPPTAKTS